jgi:hypothetical protein
MSCSDSRAAAVTTPSLFFHPGRRARSLPLTHGQASSGPTASETTQLQTAPKPDWSSQAKAAVAVATSQCPGERA